MVSGRKKQEEACRAGGQPATNNPHLRLTPSDSPVILSKGKATCLLSTHYVLSARRCPEQRGLPPSYGGVGGPPACRSQQGTPLRSSLDHLFAPGIPGFCTNGMEKHFPPAQEGKGNSSLG